MAEKRTAMVFRMKKALTKLTTFVRLCRVCRPPYRRMRSFGSDSRTAGLRCVSGDERITEKCSVRKLLRASSSRNGSGVPHAVKRFHFTVEGEQRKMAETRTAVVFHMKKALTKLTTFVRLCRVCRPPTRRMRSFGSHSRTAGLRCVLGDERITEKCSVRKLVRASSSRNGSYEDDVDQRAQIFIDNFRRQLRLERQISLQLRYYSINSSETDYEARSPLFSSLIR